MANMTEQNTNIKSEIAGLKGKKLYRIDIYLPLFTFVIKYVSETRLLCYAKGLQ